MGLGACFTGANPGYTASELIHHIRMTEAKFILTSPKTLDVSLAAAKECQIPNNNIFVLNFGAEVVPSGYQSWNALLKFGEKDWVEVKDPANTPAAYVSTSGTSGLPKAAIISHSYLVSQAGLLETITDTACKVSKLPQVTENRFLLMRWTQASYLIALPPFHVFTIPMQHALPLRTGSPVYILPRFEERGFVSAITSFQISHIITVPPILTALSKYSNLELASLRRVFVGGSCATDWMQKQLYKKLYHEARITQVYGMTEVGWVTTWTKNERDVSGSVGQIIPGARIRYLQEFILLVCH
jgi:acyl-CoA synthetase (AMP-forming)/AMP-acid ligase II